MIPAYYINLAHREDRNQRVKQELKSVGLKYKRFEAVESRNGRLGCALSHLSLIIMAKKMGLPYILICEDDICFKNTSFFKKQLQLFLKNQQDWDVLLLGGNLIPPFTPITPHIIKVKHCQTTTGYIIKQHYYNILIQNIREGIKLLLQFPENHIEYAIDKYWLSLQKRDNWFMIFPQMVSQYKSYSDIEKKVVDYDKFLTKC